MLPLYNFAIPWLAMEMLPLYNFAIPWLAMEGQPEKRHNVRAQQQEAVSDFKVNSILLLKGTCQPPLYYIENVA